MADTKLPLNFVVAPFPEGFQGDMDETFQQGFQNASAWMEGAFLQGLILPPGSTLPTTDQGPIAMGNSWYFWDPTTNSYQLQSSTVRVAKNFVRNCVYQVAQLGGTFTLGSGIIQTYDLAIARTTGASILAIASDLGPPAGPDNDFVPVSMKYTVPGPTLVPTLAATDLYVHEHLIEGSDLIMLQGEVLALSFSVFATVAGTYSAYITNNGRDRSYVVGFTITSAQANTWVRVKIPNIPAFPTSGGTWNFGDGVTGLYIGIGMGIGSQWQTATPNTWLSGFFAGTPSNVNMLTVVNNQLKITGIKLEAAASPTYLQVPSFQADLDECQRYYFTSYDYQSSTVGAWMTFVSQVAGSAAGSYSFPRRMCKTPTVVPYSISTNTAGTIRNLSTSADVTQATVPGNRKGTTFNGATAGSAKGDLLAALIRADARIT